MNSFGAGAARDASFDRFSPTDAPRRALTLGPGMPGLLVHAACVAIIAVINLSAEPWVTLVAGGALMVPVLIWAAWKEAKHAPLFLSPLSFFLAWNVVQSGLSAIYIGLRTQTGDWLTFSVAQIPPEDIATGHVVYLFGNLAFHAGLVLFHPDRKRGNRARDDFQSPLRWIIALWIAGLIFHAGNAYFSTFGTPVKILFWAPLAAVCVLALTQRENLGLSLPTWWALLMVGTCGLLVVDVTTGSKAYIMFSFLPILWMTALRPAFRKLLVPVLLLLAVMYFFVVAPTISTSRDTEIRSGETPTQHILNSFNPSGAFDNSPAAVTFVTDQIEAYLLRQFESTPTGYIVGEVRKSGLVWGATMNNAAYSFVPRILWPDKPAVQRGGWFTTYLGAAPRESESTTSTGMSAAGELYWNFGNIGVAVGMFGLGWLWAVVWRIAGTNPVKQPLPMLLYVNALFGMIAMPEAVSTYVSVIVLIVLFVPLTRMVRVRSNSGNLHPPAFEHQGFFSGRS